MNKYYKFLLTFLKLKGLYKYYYEYFRTKKLNRPKVFDLLTMDSYNINAFKFYDTFTILFSSRNDSKLKYSVVEWEEYLFLSTLKITPLEFFNNFLDEHNIKDKFYEYSKTLKKPKYMADATKVLELNLLQYRISREFDWKYTQEGFEFWNQINGEYRNHINKTFREIKKIIYNGN